MPWLWKTVECTWYGCWQELHAFFSSDVCLGRASGFVLFAVPTGTASCIWFRFQCLLIPGLIPCCASCIYQRLVGHTLEDTGAQADQVRHLQGSQSWVESWAKSWDWGKLRVSSRRVRFHSEAQCDERMSSVASLAQDWFFWPPSEATIWSSHAHPRSARCLCRRGTDGLAVKLTGEKSFYCFQLTLNPSPV